MALPETETPAAASPVEPPQSNIVKEPTTVAEIQIFNGALLAMSAVLLFEHNKLPANHKAVSGLVRGAHLIRRKLKKYPRQKPKQPSRSERWAKAAGDAEAALSELKDIQQEYVDWNGNLSDNLKGSALGEKLQAVEDLDIESAHSTVEEAANIDLPQGWGRD